MISETQRLTIIQDRYNNKQPLNLSAVAREDPQLLEGLFEPDHFVGWYETLEKAGIDYSDIHVHPSIIVTCQICGHEAENITNHLHDDHSMNAKEYLGAFPFHGETRCEEMRVYRRWMRRGKKPNTIIPHWEPAWSLLFVLDKIHTYYQKGIAVNYTNLAKNEPGLAAYGRKCLGSWDAALEAAGLNADEIREAKQQRHYNEETLIAELKKRLIKHKGRAGKLLTLSVKQRTCSLLVNQSFSVFKDYEAALSKAGIDPVTMIPALVDKGLMKDRETLIKAAKSWLKNNQPYEMPRVRQFLGEHDNAIYAFYGSWFNFFSSINTSNRTFFNSHGHLIYDSKELVIEGLKERHEAGLDIRDFAIRVDNPSLLCMVLKHFGNVSHARKAAGDLSLPEASFHLRLFKSADDILKVIRRRFAKNPQFIHQPIHSCHYKDEDFEAQVFMKWMKHFFGNHDNALDATGLEIPPKRASYHSRKDVIKGLQKRFADNLGMRQSDLLEVLDKGGDYLLSDAITKFFKGYSIALKAAGLRKPKRNTPPREYDYVSREEVIAELQARVERGQGVRCHELSIARKRGGNLRLYDQCKAFFDSHLKALEAAGVEVDK